MPELGTLSEKQAASLAGLAPFACGTLRGVRRIYGGRPKVRHALFHIARVGLRHNPVLKLELNSPTGQVTGSTRVYLLEDAL
jgi:transposase